MDEIDQLLAKLDQAKPNTPPVNPSQPSSDRLTTTNYGSIDGLLKSLGESAKQQVQYRLSTAVSEPNQFSSAVSQKIVPEIQEYQEVQATQAQAEQQQYQQRKAALQQQRRQELEQQAQIWLQKLDHRSDEGRWFDEFACHYESRLVAAIEYFIALQEINSPLP